jgi:hypothetical protein
MNFGLKERANLYAIALLVGITRMYCDAFETLVPYT